MQEDWKPKLKMILNSIEDACKFLVDYDGKVEFGVRKYIIYKFVCCKEGLRKPYKQDYKTINPKIYGS